MEWTKKNSLWAIFSNYLKKKKNKMVVPTMFPMEHHSCEKKSGATSLRKKSNINPKSHLPLRSNYHWGASFQMFEKKIQKYTLPKSNIFLYHLENSHNLNIESDLAFSIWSHDLKVTTKIRPLFFFLKHSGNCFCGQFNHQTWLKGEILIIKSFFLWKYCVKTI